MLNKYLKEKIFTLLPLIFVLFIAGNSQAQTIYYHNFDATTTPSHPYTITPTTLDPHLSGSSWTNTSSLWATSAGSVPPGPSISYTAASGSVITLTFNVAAGYQAEITSFNFWTQRSSSAPTGWSLAINGTNVGSGTNPTIIAPVGVTPISPAITGLTGTVTITLTLSGGTSGNFRLDDFTLNGSLIPNCTPAVISSFLPLNGPVNTIVTIAGSGFTNASSVKFNSVAATAFAVVSDTQIKATVPETASPGNITIMVNGCEATSSTPFTVTTPACTGSATDIFISELYDQKGGNGGMIELYNPTSLPINLSGYTVYRFADMGPFFDTLNLTGTINANSTYLIACTVPNQVYCAAPTSAASIGTGFNGSDKIELLKTGVVIDRVIVPFTAAGFTLIRKPNAVVPTPTYDSNDWINTQHPGPSGPPSIPNTYCDNLGIHTITTTPLPVITQPVTITACENGNTTFTTTVTPSTGYTYQWKVLNAAGTWVNVVNNTTYAGAATNTLTVSQIPLTFDGNQYYCEMISATCNLVSNAAQLYVITAPSIATVTTTQPTCTMPSGSITVITPIGTGLTYSINGTNFQAGTTFANLAPGNYTVTIKNTAGCTSVTPSVTINTVPGAPAAAIVSITQPTCTVVAGTITINSPTGTGLTYSIDGTNFQSGTTFNNLPAGTYTVTVMNTAGCSSVSPNHVINSQSAPPAVAVTTVTQPICTTATGTITVDSPTGTGLTYSIDGITFQAATIFTNLAPGTYTITIQNTAGCTSVTPIITINPAPTTPAIADVTLTQPTCTVATGTIIVNTPTGAGITYSIDGTTFQPATTFTNLAPGTYTVTVVNAAGCTSVSPNHVINVQPALPAIADTAAVQPTCTSPSGTITVNTPIGTGIEYSIDGTTFQTTTSFANLAAGNYTITVRNAAGCTSVTAPVTINAVPNAPAAANVTVTQPTCITATGTITINTPTGTGITYSIDGTTYQSGTSFSNLTAGTYTITVMNAAGCTSVSPNHTITAQPASPAIADVITTQPTCAAPTGTITVNSPLGAGLTYSINGTSFQPGTSFTNLAPGSYTVTVRNAAGCTSVTPTITIDAVPASPAVANVTVIQPTCTIVTGTININSPIGTGLEYSIDGTIFQTTASFTNLAPGTYTITVRNTIGCSSVSSPVIVNAVPGQPDPATAVITQPSCTTPTGTITVESPLGTDLAYAINGVNFQTSTEFNNVAAGTYTITVMNTSGCYSTSPGFVVNTPPQAAPVAAPPTPIEECDFNNDGYAKFDMTDVIEAIENSLTDVTVTVHETPEDAGNNANKVPNTDQYINVDQHVQTLYLRINSNTTDCFSITTLQLIVNPVPIATIPSDYALCDDGASDLDGIATFNLSTKTAEVLGTLDPSQYSVSYHTTQAAATAGTPSITAVTNYPSASTTLYVRVTNTATGCFAIVPLKLIVNPLPTLITNESVYTLCDTTEPSGKEIFDLTSKIGDFIADASGMDITFHRTVADAQAKINAITTPAAYENEQAPVQTLVLNIMDAETGCFRIAFLDIRVEHQPIILPPAQDELTVCDTNGQGIGVFDLEALVAGMINGDPDIVITFHESYEDAQSGVNAIPDPQAYMNSTPYFQSIYVRAVDTRSGCSNTIPYELILTVEPAPQAPGLADLTFCDDQDNNNSNTTRVVNLTVQNQVIADALGIPVSDIPTVINVEYYTTSAGANSGLTGRITTPSAYNGTNGQVIWVRVENPDTECYSVTSFKLIINAPIALTIPTMLVKCNEALPNDSQAEFDLTVKEDEILGINGVGQGAVFTYYPSPGDAAANTNAIGDPTAYVNTPAPPSVKTLGVKVTTKEGCVSFTTLTIKVLPLPTPDTTPDALVSCDDNGNGDGTEIFDLTQAQGDISDNGDYEYTYFTSEADANANENPIADPANYTSGSGFVWVRVVINTGNAAEPLCAQAVQLELIVNPLPPIADLNSLAHCEQGTDGADTFNLPQELNEVLEGQGVDPADFDIDFFSDAALTTPAVPLTAYPVTGGQGTVYVRVENLETGCQIVKELTLYVEEAATANPVTDRTECDYEGANDGFITWDLTPSGLEALGTQSPADYSVSYYETAEDAAATPPVNAIADPAAYVNSTADTKEIWVVVTNTSTVSGCNDITSFILTVERLAEPVITGENGSNTVCIDFGDTEGLLVLDSGVVPNGHSYEWFKDGVSQGTDASGIFAATTGGVYTVVVTSAAGCESAPSAGFTVIESGQASAIDRGYYVTNYFSDNQTITITVQGNGEYEYQLDNGPRQDSPVFTNVSPGVHKVTVYDVKTGFPCDALELSGVSVVDYPNFFTPNGDGFHDTWNIIGLQNTGAVIYIFDRYGKLIKQISPDLESDGWDGTFNGAQLPADDYWFSVTYPEFNGTNTVTKEFKAHFSLKR